MCKILAGYYRDVLSTDTDRQGITYISFFGATKLLQSSCCLLRRHVRDWLRRFSSGKFEGKKHTETRYNLHSIFKLVG